MATQALERLPGCGHPPGTLVKGSWGNERGEERGMIQGTETQTGAETAGAQVQVHWCQPSPSVGVQCLLCASAVPTHSQEGVWLPDPGFEAPQTMTGSSWVGNLTSKSSANFRTRRKHPGLPVLEAAGWVGDWAPSLTGKPPALACEQWSELWSVEGACKTSAHTEQRTGLSGTLEIADVRCKCEKIPGFQSQAVRW